MSEWEEGRIEVSVVNAANLPRLHVGSMHAIQVVDRETCTALVLPGASQDEAERLLRMIVDGNPGGEMTSQNPTTDDTVTSQNGHCEHCDRDSCYDDGEEHEDGLSWHLTMPEDALGSTSWQEGFCPACAERERIVAWMRDHEGREKYHDTYWDQWVTVDLSKNDYADKIERGAHLEGQ